MPYPAQAVITIVGGLVGVLALAAALYLLLLAVAAFFHRPERLAMPAQSRLLVLIPAHDEEALIGRCLSSLRAQTYPTSRFRVVVIADNCTDGTASIAEGAGAEVMVRTEPLHRGKGQALRWAIDRLLSAPEGFDAAVVVDADSVADPDLLAVLESHMVAGEGVVQAEYLALQDDDSLRSRLRSAAFLLFHRTRLSGGAALGMPCNLVGNGMLFERGVLERHPWRAFSGVEDLEHSIDLRLAGVRPAFASQARVYGPVAAHGRGAETQRRRWEGGRFHLMRTRLWPLVVTGVRRRDGSCLAAAADLAVPPLGLLCLQVAVGAVATGLLVLTGGARAWALVPWLVASAAIPAYVLIGLRSAGAPRSHYLALLQAPTFLLGKVGTYLRMTRGLEAHRWERSERPSAASCPAPAAEAARIDVAGVPIDPVDLDGAVARIMASVGSSRLLQICTVNLQFLVNAQRDGEIREVLNQSALNLPDGAPVLWLARILGRRLPGRVAGADLLLPLLAAAGVAGARVFLLGGERGSADLAGRRLQSRCPGLVICGTHEPPVAAHDMMDNEDILRRIAQSRADLLLVALGHPKQERWIHLNRSRLTVAVAIGVGCSLDLVAGRRARAPRWMRRCALEWLYRLLHEPRRLLPRYAVGMGWLALVLLPRTLARRLSHGPRGAL